MSEYFEAHLEQRFGKIEIEACEAVG